MDDSMVGRVARKLTATLKHHGVEMHPDDVRGLAQDTLAELHDPTGPMVTAATNKAAQIGAGDFVGIFRAMIDAAAEG